VSATIKKAAIGRATAALIEANDVYRPIRKTIIQTTPNETNTRGGNKERTAPAKVAIPLPPLKPSQMG
jgi:hypothetical protein